MILIRNAPKADPADQRYAEPSRARYDADEIVAELLDRGLRCLPNSERRLLIDWHATTWSPRAIARKHDIFFSRIDEKVQLAECHWEDATKYCEQNQEDV